MKNLQELAMSAKAAFLAFGEKAKAWGKQYGRHVGLVLGCVVVGVAGAFALLPAPHVQGSMQGSTVEIHRNAQIRLVFDQSMNHKSVENAFSITPSVMGSFSWEGNVLVFSPQGLQKGATYVVKMSDAARNSYGKRLADGFTQSFVVLDYPEVSVVAPVKDVEIRQGQTLTVLFDHPMRALTGSLDVPNLLRIEPPVKGKYNWLGTSGFEFIPENGWPAATDFKVTVPKETKMADGSTLLEDYVWSFWTPGLTVDMSVLPGHIGPKDAVSLVFNYPLAPQVVRDALKISQGATSASMDQFDVVPSKDDAKILLISKHGGWGLGNTFTFSLPKDFTGGLGPRGLVTDWSASITTDDKEFHVVLACPDAQEKMMVSESAVIRFNNPVDMEDIKKRIRITPAIEGMEIQANGWSRDGGCNGEYGDGRSITIVGRLKPSTVYKVTLAREARDIYAQTLSKERIWSFETDPYQPAATLSSYSQVGLLDSYLPRLYQVRTLNLHQPIPVTLCQNSAEDYMNRTGGAKCDPQFKAQFPTETTLNQYNIIDLDLDKIRGERLPLGFYSLVVDLSQILRPYVTGPYTELRQTVISDTALTLKQDRAGKLLVWATDMKSGQPVPDLDVTVYSRVSNGASSDVSKVKTGKTDAQGVLLIALDEGGVQSVLPVFTLDYVVIARSNEHLGYAETNWQDGISPWNYNLNVSDIYSPFTKHIGYIYTDRRIYRPDQQVFFKGVIRKDVDAALGVPDRKDVTVTINTAEGKNIYYQKLPLSAYGTFNGMVKLDPSMPLGSYVIQVQPPEGEDALEWSIVGNFDVREYRRPDFKVEAKTPPAPVMGGQKAALKVHSEYYQGVALSGAKVNYEITRNTLYFQPNFGEWYNYTVDESADCYWYCKPNANFENVASGELKLDASGNVDIPVSTDLSNYKGSATYYVNVTVTDVNGRTGSYNAQFDVHRGSFYMGIRGNYDAGWDSAKADFDIVSINPDGSKHASAAASVVLYKRTWSNVKMDGNGGQPTWDWQKTDTQVATQGVTTDGEGKARASFTPGADGEYVAIVTSHDEAGHVIQASASRYVYRSSADRIGGATTRITDDHQMQVVQNKAEYKPGDTAELVVQTPYANTKALVSVERETIREYHVVDLGTNNRVIKVPITDASTPNVFVSVLAVQGGGEKDIPDFRLGYANLQVNTSNKILDIQLTPDKSEYKPGEPVTVKVHANVHGGGPAAAEISLAVVDERVVALLGSIDTNILGRFWFERSIGVFTSQSLTQLVKKVFFATEGGGGGKGDGGVPAVRGNFLDTALWKADIVTDSNGDASVKFNLPDNLTSWQLLAIGATKDTVVGSAEAKIVTRKELMVEPVMPRILRHNDRATLGATVFNTTDKAITLDVGLVAKGVQVDGAASRSIELPANGRTAVLWNVRVPYGVSTANFVIRAQGGGLDDGFTVDLPVLDYSVPEVVSTSGFVEKRASEELQMPEDIIPNLGELTMSVSPNIGSNLSSGIDYLLDYQYGCSEQTTSAVLAGLAYDQLNAKKLVTSDAAAVQKAKDKVMGGISKLIAMQTPDGSWGFWSNSDEGSPYLTAYALQGLTQAKAAGYSVDEAALSRADDYLRGSMNGADWLWWWGDDARATALFVLSERDTRDLSGIAAGLYERRAGLSQTGRIYLAMTYGNLSHTSSVQTSDLLSTVKNNLTYLDPTTAYVSDGFKDQRFFGSDEQVTALYLTALLRLEPQTVEIDRLVHYLVRARKQGYWNTTHATAAVLLSLVEYAKQHPVDLSPGDLTVFIDNAAKHTMAFAQGDVSPTQNLTVPLSELKDVQTHQVSLEKETDTRYVYDMSMKVYREAADIKPFENGFTLISDYYAPSDKKYEHPLHDVKQGDFVRVHMKLLVPKRHEFVALESHLPSGLEAVDQTLLTSPAGSGDDQRQCDPNIGENECPQFAWEWNWWWGSVWKHIEQRDDKVFLFSEALEPGIYEYSYLAQAITPGTFTIPPARVYEFYDPRANAHTEARTLIVR